MRRLRLRSKTFIAALALLVAFALVPFEAFAARSGGSFSSRGGFRSAPSAPRSYPGGGYSSRRSTGPNVVVVPGFGWGFSPFGWGLGGGSLFGSLLMLGVLGVGAAFMIRAVRRAQTTGPRRWQAGWGEEPDHDDEPMTMTDRAWVYKVQLGLGRSARGIQERLAKFAAEGDTSSERGLAQLLQQTGLELMREKDSIRYALAEADGPMSLGNGETKMNALALAERSRFQVERVRGADGTVRSSDAAAVTGPEALEYIVVTVIVATRQPIAGWKTELRERSDLDGLLGQLGGVSPSGLLGLEVVWTPADPDDSLTETDVLTTYHAMRSI